MRVESRYGDARRFDAERPAPGVRNADDLQHARLFHPVARLAQRYVRRDVDDAKILVREHHGVFIGMGEMCVYFGVAGEVMPGHVDGFLAQGVRDGRVHLAGERQLDHPLYILKRRLAAERRCAEPEGFGILRPAGDVLRFYDAETQYIDRAGDELRVRRTLHGADADIRPHPPVVYRRSIFHRGGVADDKRAAALIDRRVRESAHRDLRAVAERIAHRDAEDRFFRCVHVVFPSAETELFVFLQHRFQLGDALVAQAVERAAALADRVAEQIDGLFDDRVRVAVPEYALDRRDALLALLGAREIAGDEAVVDRGDGLGIQIGSSGDAPGAALTQTGEDRAVVSGEHRERLIQLVPHADERLEIFHVAARVLRAEDHVHVFGKTRHRLRQELVAGARRNVVENDRDMHMLCDLGIVAV